ncbi:DUF192 domain-containing protein [Thioclava pacifica]|uniref:DUF192 domain-containing protein n=1 Tax=Thioclava pacifica DSM 10166 TaxID=1353537 RepID=A0A074JKC5_9RHOB|nr:DUF192 domain-containing protein [Thioclava pacifica]KEO56340.1 hypothetical protein TP2_02090 [Thioclava pacifica DSM 10166]
MGRFTEIRALIAFASVFFAAPAFAQAGEAVQCREDLAILRQGGTRVEFHIEIADDAGERAQGLMGRTSMASGAGMLFIYPAPREVFFWMHDTPLPLDMLFIDAAGRVVNVAANARPNDDTPIPSGAPVRFVLEINAGLAAKLGLGPGAELAHPSIDPALAAFPCK